MHANGRAASGSAAPPPALGAGLPSSSVLARLQPLAPPHHTRATLGGSSLTALGNSHARAHLRTHDLLPAAAGTEAQALLRQDQHWVGAQKR